MVETKPLVGWFEVITENFMVAGGNPRRVLEALRRDYPVVLHGVSLSIASTDPLDQRYLAELAALARDVEPAWISDHLCWGTAHGINAHDPKPDSQGMTIMRERSRSIGAVLAVEEPLPGHRGTRVVVRVGSPSE